MMRKSRKEKAPPRDWGDGVLDCGPEITKTISKRQREHEEQAALIEWTEYNYIRFPELKYLYAVPNGARTSHSQAIKLKREGMKAGVPDLVLPVPRGKYHGLYIEMKADGGRPSPEQKDWIKFLNGQGILAVVCYGWLQAKDTLEEYLEQP